MRECWLVQQLVRQIEVISFADGSIVARRVFTTDEPVSSSVLPQFEVTPADMLAEV